MEMGGEANSEGSRLAAPAGAELDQENAPANWRQSKWLAVGELVVVALIFWADFAHHIYFSKTPYLLLFGWISLRVRKLRWRDVGLSRFRNWKTTIGLGIAAGLALEGFELFVSQPILVRLLGQQPDLEDFRALTGNLKMTLLLYWFGCLRHLAKRWFIAVT